MKHLYPHMKQARLITRPDHELLDMLFGDPRELQELRREIASVKRENAKLKAWIEELRRPFGEQNEDARRTRSWGRPRTFPVPRRSFVELDKDDPYYGAPCDFSCATHCGNSVYSRSVDPNPAIYALLVGWNRLLLCHDCLAMLHGQSTRSLRQAKANA